MIAMKHNEECIVCQLIHYGLDHVLIEEADIYWCANRVAYLLKITFSPDFTYTPVPYDSLYAILNDLLSIAVDNGVIHDSIVEKDILDTQLTGILTPAPSTVNHIFASLSQKNSQQATEWLYQMQKDVNYIRANRIEKDRRWPYEGTYGTMEITINLSKPELDPKSIAAMKQAEKQNYPYDLLCEQNVGFAGHANHPSRMNLRQIPLTLDHEHWLLQYSPYAYFDQHCIVLTKQKREMKIDQHAFASMLDFVDAFPHYFIGSNSDLPISGGSILGHEHFQGGMHVFPMNQAPLRKTVFFEGYPSIQAGIVQWPMSVLRLSGKDRNDIIHLSTRILHAWQCYSDPKNMIYDHVDGVLRNTITPIVHLDHGTYVMELVLRNNLTTKQYPLGYFHPHPDLHHIKKENIGLIEVMGLAILPARLQKEMQSVRNALVLGEDLNENPLTSPHAKWVSQWITNYEMISEDHIDSIIEQEIGKVFEQVLSDCAVLKTDKAFERFLQHVNQYREP